MYGSSSLIYIRTIDGHDNEETNRQTDKEKERKKGRKKESIFDFVLYEIVLLCTNTMRQQFGYSLACLLFIEFITDVEFYWKGITYL